MPPFFLKSRNVVAGTLATPAALAVDASQDVHGIIGQITCINVAPMGEPEKIRYFGRGKGCSGQAHETAAQAVQDVQDWHAGKPVSYPKHAEVKLPKQGKLTGVPSSRTVGSLYPTAPDGHFVIGPKNTWLQAWEALLAGHAVRQPGWPASHSWILVNPDILLVIGNTRVEWLAWLSTNRERPIVNRVSAQQMLAVDWEVQQKIDHLNPVI